ncbi:hypothetical protein Nepgr_004253 [Nepenthes gracilis]|uniref:Endopeptidase S2P n=1 Tax=Nepenthes gracilis TaxID=150966 RepID=A0AAD3XEU9_NEPGR|nr:hypothetical protein Nepgr_004253 [Nepenthes gracilis]
MEARRLRRFARAHAHTLLPLRSRQRISNTISCWYCDLKISALNESIYIFGQKHARFLRVWFTIGTGFSLSVLLGVVMMLIFQLTSFLTQHNGMEKLNDLFSNLLFGFSPTFLGFKMSFTNFGYLLVSTMISIAVHELGHAVAAASEGIQMEYIAVFIAAVFPGALVGFNQEVLETKSRSSVLRIYCAGIWHNAVCGAACGVALLLLPFIFSPLYIHGESPMVLKVLSTSPVSGYLLPGDVIVSLDGIKIHNAHDWLELATLIEKMTLQNSSHIEDVNGSVIDDGRKGYCAPSSVVEKSPKLPPMIKQPSCPDNLTAFTTFPCSIRKEDQIQNISKSMLCLNAADIVKLKRCDGLKTTDHNGSSCLCSKDELCISPVQAPGVAWVEITYHRPFSQQCLGLWKNLSAGGLATSEFGESCDGTFLFVGDMVSMAQSVWLTLYQPRWSSAFAAYLPDMIEKLLMCTFHVSLTLALVNCLPVYFLDGESILEVSICYITFFNPRGRRIFLQACLFVGSAISCLLLLRTFLKFW